MKHNI